MTAPSVQLPVIEMHGVTAGSMRDLASVVVEDVNWTVHAGEFWVIGGLQGAGKSDFMMLAGGLMAPREGRYQFMGNDMPIFEDSRLDQRLKLGLVFDGGQLLNHLTIAENIALPLRYHRNMDHAGAREQVQRILDLTDLAPWADSTPGAIGRNWQKRAGLARALMLKPEVLLVDNPLGGLDMRHRWWWLDFLKQLSAGSEWSDGRPMTLIVSTDDLRLWRRRAGRFAMLNGKTFLVLGTWDQAELATDEHVREMIAASGGG